MPVTLSFNSVDYDLVIASYTPGQEAVPGEGGSPAKIQASCGSRHLRFFDQLQYVHDHMAGHHLYGVAGSELHLDVGTAGAITEGLTGSGLVARDNGGTVLITEAASPFVGGAIHILLAACSRFR
ncbi:putative kinase [Klebsiella pneumoniae]|nr:putative kinase [Klebsiella pneumoniae]